MQMVNSYQHEKDIDWAAPDVEVVKTRQRPGLATEELIRTPARVGVGQMIQSSLTCFPSERSSDNTSTSF